MGSRSVLRFVSISSTRVKRFDEQEQGQDERPVLRRACELADGAYSVPTAAGSTAASRTIPTPGDF